MCVRTFVCIHHHHYYYFLNASHKENPYLAIQAKINLKLLSHIFYNQFHLHCVSKYTNVFLYFSSIVSLANANKYTLNLDPYELTHSQRIVDIGTKTTVLP